MAMRGGGFPQPNRFPAPRPQVRGRGGFAPRPMGQPFSMPSQPRPMMQQPPLEMLPTNNDTQSQGIEQQQQQQLQENQMDNSQPPQISNQIEEVKSSVRQQEDPFMSSKQNVPKQVQESLQQINEQQELQLPQQNNRNERSQHNNSSIIEEEKKSEIFNQQNRSNQEPEVVKEEKDQKEEEKKEPNANNNQQSLLDIRNNRFFGMINGFISFLSRRKQAYTGRPASQMYWDEKRKRYIIDPDDVLDDDVPPPPPPVSKKSVEQTSAASVFQSNIQEEVKQEAQATNPTDLTKPALPGYLANRGRGRGRGGASMPMNRFPNTFNSAQLMDNSKAPTSIEEQKSFISEGQEQSTMMIRASVNNNNLQQESAQIDTSIREEQPSELYMTTLDITMAQNNSQEQQMIMMMRQSVQQVKEEGQELNLIRESQWMEKFSSQQEKINNLKYKASMLQQELRMQREENEQTIENFTTLCQDLKFKGMDEVEDLQSEVQILRDQLRKLAQDKAGFEIKNTQLADALHFFENENSTLYEQLRDSKYSLLQSQIENEVNREQHSHGDSSQLDELQREIMNLKMENDSLKWQKSIIEAEKLQKVIQVKEATYLNEQIKDKLSFLESANRTLQDDIRKLHHEQSQATQDQVTKLEKEKDSLREMISKIQIEKDRIQDNNRERLIEYEARAKKAEADKAKVEQDTSKAVRDRDASIEQLKTQMALMSQTIQQRDLELVQYQNQITQQQLKLTQLQQKRHSESELTESMMRTQLKQIQEILQQKTAKLEDYESKHLMISEELFNQNNVRNKLSANIIYLQNEIRKRDELLESSEFGDFDIIDDEDSSLIAAEDESIRGQDMQSVGDDGPSGQSQRHSQYVNIKKKKKTFGQQLQNQLDDTRMQLKQQIEERMRIERQMQSMQRNITKLSEGVADVNGILDQQHQNMGIIANSNYEQSSSLFEEVKHEDASKDDSLIQKSEEHLSQIISKVFAVSRHYESELSELKHKLKLLAMQLEESENLKFDIEMLNEEKAMNESDILQFKQQLKDAQSKLTDVRKQLLESHQTQDSLKQQMHQQRADFEHRMTLVQTEHELKLQQQATETQAKIEEIHEAFKTQLLPQLKQKHKSKYQQLQDQFLKMREEMSIQLTEQKQLNATLEEQNRLMLNQSQMQNFAESEEKAKLQDQITNLEFQKQEVENAMLHLKSNSEEQILLLKQEIRDVNNEMKEQNKQYTLYKEQLESDFKQAALQLKGKIDEKKNYIKDIHQKFRDQVQQMMTEHQNEIEQMKQQSEDALNERQAVIEERLAEIQVEKWKIQGQQVVIKDLEHKLTVHQEEGKVEKPDQNHDKIESLNQEIAAKEQKLQALISENEELHTKIKDLQNDIPSSDNMQQLELLKQEYDQKIQELEDGKNSEIDNLQNIMRQIKTQMREESEKQQAQIHQLEQQLALNKESTSDNTQMVNEEIQNKINKKKAKIAHMKENINNLTTQHEETLKQLQDQHAAELTKLQMTIEQLQASQQHQSQEADLSIKLTELEQQWQAKLSEKEAEFDQERTDMLQHYTSREEEFQSMAEQVAIKLKGQVKKEKERTKNALISLEQAQKDIGERDAQIEVLEQQLQDTDKRQQDQEQQLQVMKDQMKAREEEIVQKEDQINELQAQVDNLREQADTLREDLQLMKSDLTSLLQSFDITLDTNEYNDVWKSCLSQLKELLSNYKEDQRSLKVLMQEKDELSQQRDLYYHEKESIAQEKSILEGKWENSQASKLERRCKLLEEERSEMRSDFYLKINSFVEEVSQLKHKLSLYEGEQSSVERPGGGSQHQTLLADLSKASVKDAMILGQASFMDESKTSNIQERQARQQEEQAQKSGLFNSIASFFLTDSEIEATGTEKQ